jgi:hypothetical protein
MRIIIELSEAESHATSIRHEPTAAEAAAMSQPAAADGGQPSEALLAALGAKAEPGAERKERPTGRNGATDAGTPPAWLVATVQGQSG